MYRTETLQLETIVWPLDTQLWTAPYGHLWFCTTDFWEDRDWAEFLWVSGPVPVDHRYNWRWTTPFPFLYIYYIFSIFNMKKWLQLVCVVAKEFKQYVSLLCRIESLGRKQELLYLRCTSVFDAILCSTQSLISGQGKTHVSFFW